MNDLSLLELAELLLVASYEETESLGHANFFISVTEIAGNLGIVDQAQIIDACHLLEEKGCFLLAFDHVTALSASITPEGENYIARGGETGIIGEYRRFIASKRVASGEVPGIEFEGFGGPHFEPATPVEEISASPAAVPPSPPAERGELKQIIASLEMLINNDASLPASQRADLIADLKSLEFQLLKTGPKKPVIEALASDLKKSPVFAALVDLLIAKI